MTGYGRGSCERARCRVAVEIRSVNHRFIDVKLRGAVLDPAVEDKVKGLLRERLSRGALTVTFRVEGQIGGASPRIDMAAARRVHAELVGLAQVLGMPAEVSLDLLCSQPGVMVATDSSHGDDELAEAALEAADAALKALIAMRSTEGTALAGDLTQRLATLRQLTETLAELVESAPADAQQRLEDRLSRLLSGGKVSVDESRLAQEVALVADRQDVTEELVRTRSHLGQLEELLTANEPVGRRLDFLVQELGREFNTISAKSQSAEIARTVVEVKAELEKIREQIQNVE